MSKLFAALALACAGATAFAQTTTLICIWETTGGKKQSYIVEFDAQSKTVAFNGIPASDPEITSEFVNFVLKFKDVHWTHNISRVDGQMKVIKSDSSDTLHIQCGKLVTNGF
jgi:hypothetical protein